MKAAYLIDNDSIGGGNEYIRLKIASRVNDECRVFYSDRGECRARKLDEWGADEIIVNHLKALLQLLGNPFKRPKGKLTFVVHGLHVKKFPPHSLSFRLRRRLESWLYGRCDRIVALTPGDREDIHSLYGRHLKVDVEPNTLDGWVPNLAAELPADLKGDFKYLYIGRFDREKGQDRWIRQLKSGDGRTLFIGDGAELPRCKALARELGVADLCEFAGAIPDADRYLKCVPIVVLTSRREGMPYLLLKARALGCEIVTSNCRGICDVMRGYDKWTRLNLP